MKAPATVRAYAQDWATFTAWCNGHRHQPLPALPGTVALFAKWLVTQGRKFATVARAVAAITDKHVESGHPSPRGPALASCLRKLRGAAPPPREPEPLTLIQMNLISEALPRTLHGQRDRAMLLVGFHGGFRRSELVSLDVADVAFTFTGATVSNRRAGRFEVLEFSPTEAVCPVRALRAWLKAALISEGPLFRAITKHGKISHRALSDRSVCEIVRHGAERAEFKGHFSAESLRAGREMHDNFAAMKARGELPPLPPRPEARS